jgi:alpha,alpha-trehalase
MQWTKQAQARAESVNALMYNSSTGRWHDLYASELDRCATGAAEQSAHGGTHSNAGAGLERMSCALEPAKQSVITVSHVEQLGVQDSATAVSWLPFLWGMPHNAMRHDDASSSAVSAPGIVQRMRSSSLIGANGLLNTTAVRSGQQWDVPNSWPPLLCMWVDGLLEHGGAEGSQMATKLGQAYLRAVQLGLESSGVVWEKYGTETLGQCGGGGEYDAQVGFGWSNGVALHFMCTLGITMDLQS